MPRQPLKSRKSYQQVPITQTRCGHCKNLKPMPEEAHACIKTGDLFAAQELVPKDFAMLCYTYDPLM